MTMLADVVAAPVMLLPIVVFVAVFALVVVVSQRQSVALGRLERHALPRPGVTATTRPALVQPGRPARPGLFARLSARLDRVSATNETRLLLSRAGNPMSAAAYAKLRRLCIILAPVFAVLALLGLGRTLLGFAGAGLVLVTLPRLPGIYLQRLAKQRARQMDAVIADVLDLLVVCVEGGQSLAAGLMQVANRMDNVAAEEFQRVLHDINSGVSRRDAFLALADRCQSEALGIACTTIVQADKVGMSIASTLRTLSDMMRARRRQTAETKARQAPIKMMPVLVGFMLPAMLALLIGPVAIQMLQTFQ